MSEYSASVEWKRDGATFTDNKYSRVHSWHFDGGVDVRASSSPHAVPLPMSDAAAVDPEEALVVALSSCHMLSFLAIAASRGFVVDSYRDTAVGEMNRNESGRLAITVVTLHPNVAFSGARVPDCSELDAMHHEAHDVCYIANSVRADVRCEPIVEDA